MVNQPIDSARKRFTQRFNKDISEFDSIKRATEALALATRRSYLNDLSPYFLFLDQDPDIVIAQRKSDVLGDDLERIERYEKRTNAYLRMLIDEKHYSGRAANGILGRIQGFFSNNSKRYSLDMRKKVKLPKARRKPKYSPTNEELRHLYSFCENYRDRLIVSLMYQNALSPVDVAELQIDDLPQKEWAYYEKSRSKTGEVWRGIITPDIFHDLQAYLKVRDSNSKNLFTSRQGDLDNKGISEVVSNLIKKAGLNDNSGFSPKSLRDAFEDAMISANVNPKIKESLMGHVSGIEHEYGGQRQLETNCIEAIKKAYPLMTLNGFSRMSDERDQMIKDLKDEIKSLKNEVQFLKDEAEQNRKDWERVFDSSDLAFEVNGVMKKASEMTEEDWKIVDSE